MKKLLIALIAMGLAGFAQASYLYWQVSQEAVNEFASGEGSYGVQVKYGEKVLNVADLTGVDTGKTVVNVTAAQTPGYLVNIDDLSSGSSFYIELVKYVDSAWSTVGVSSELAYGDVGQYTVDLNAIAPVLPQAWTGGTYSVPEPTSGVLMLIGLAGLALKRRKV